jgi:hypothetical protein
VRFAHHSISHNCQEKWQSIPRGLMSALPLPDQPRHALVRVANSCQCSDIAAIHQTIGGHYRPEAISCLNIVTQ